VLSDATVTVLVKLLAVGLLGVTGVVTVVLLSEGDLSAAVPGLLGLYVGVVLAIGVFTERPFDDRVQAAFAVGIVAWGVHVHLVQSTPLGGVLVLTGSFALASELRELLGG
jgi:hypothetical protein